MIFDCESPVNRPVTAPASEPGRSAITNANAPGSNKSDCLEVCAAIVALTVPVEPTKLIVALFAGSAVTVWSAEPGPMIGGLMLNVAVLEPERSACTVNACKSPVSTYVTGFTELTPAMRNVSPALNAYVPQPEVSSVEPDCNAPLTRGVEIVNVPVVCTGMFGSFTHVSTPRAPSLNWPVLKYLEICACGLNAPMFAPSSLECVLTSSAACKLSSGTAMFTSSAMASSHVWSEFSATPGEPNCTVQAR